MYVQAVGIGEKTLGPHHPDLATWLSNRALCLTQQVRAEISAQDIICDAS